MSEQKALTGYTHQLIAINFCNTSDWAIFFIINKHSRYITLREKISKSYLTKHIVRERGREREREGGRERKREREREGERGGERERERGRERERREREREREVMTSLVLFYNSPHFSAKSLVIGCLMPGACQAHPQTGEQETL